jgi:hypothetical protein
LGIAVGTKTLLTTLQELLDNNMNCVNLKNLPPRPKVFAVGDTVDVGARMGPRNNLPGGVATVVSRTTAGGGEVVFTVRCTINGGSESDLPVAPHTSRR